MERDSINSVFRLSNCDLSVSNEAGQSLTNISVIRLHSAENNAGMVEFHKELGEWLKAARLVEDPEYYYS